MYFVFILFNSEFTRKEVIGSIFILKMNIHHHSLLKLTVKKIQEAKHKQLLTKLHRPYT